MTIDINELRRKINSTDVVDHIDLHANIKPFLSEMIDRLEAAEKELAELRSSMKFRTSLIERTEAERDALRAAVRHEADCVEACKSENDALRAKVERMERQEPVAWLHETRRDSDVVTDAVKHVWGKVAVGSMAAYSIPLYVLPGAQPQLNEIRTALQRALELGARETWTGARKHRSREDQREEQQCWNKVWSLLGAQGEEK